MELEVEVEEMVKCLPRDLADRVLPDFREHSVQQLPK